MAIVAEALHDKLVAGAPFPGELAALASLGVDSEKLAPLKPMAEGGPSGATLSSAFAQLAPSILAAAAKRDGGSISDRFLDHLRGLVVVHDLSEKTGDDPDALVTQVEALSRPGDLTGALAAFARLPEHARKVAAGWAAEAGRRKRRLRRCALSRGCDRSSVRGQRTMKDRTAPLAGALSRRKARKSRGPMFRLLIFLVGLAAAAWGLMWFADNPGIVDLTWRGVDYRFSLTLALEAIIVLAVLVSIVWAVLRFVFNLPSLAKIGARSRRRDKGLKAISRGMIAVGAGDGRAASRHAAEAAGYAPNEPMTSAAYRAGRSSVRRPQGGDGGL